MSRNAPSNVKHILNSCESFVKVIEDPNWVRTATVDDIKMAFKLGSYIEKTMEHLASNNSVLEFTNILHKWWSSSDRLKVYDKEFFVKACDKLLACVFQTENISDNSLDIATRVYTSIFPKERMEKVISDVILMKCSFDAISDFINIHLNRGDIRDLEYRIKLQNWTFLVQTCRVDSVKEEISEMLSLYKVESSLYLLIGILSLKDNDFGEKQTQEIVLKSITDSMLDRSILSKPFWLTLFKKINVTIVSNACVKFERFYDCLLNFVIYCGSMMKKENGVWISDPVISVCPEIGYHDILIHIKDFIKVDPEKQTSVIDKLKQAEKDTGSNIWNEILLNF